MAENTPSSALASDGGATDVAPVETPPPMETSPALETAASPIPDAVPAPPAPPAASGTAPAPKRRGAGRWIAITLVLVFVLAIAGGGGAYLASASLSKTYSPERALATYFDAQKRGDVNAMWANANYLRGDGSFEQFFSKDALTAMLSIDQNKAITDVAITSSRVVDSSTTVLTVSLQWGRSPHPANHTLHKNLGDTHYFFFNTWKLDIPYTTIGLTLPNQPGAITVDSISMPSSATTSVQAIAGYHNVTMGKTAFYDASTKLANGVDVSPNVTFDGTISSAAKASVAAAIRTGANVCDASRYTDCPGHTYHSAGAAYTIYFLDGLPGYPGGIQYNYYVFNYSGDLTAGMQLEVPKDEGLMYASGTCAMTMTVDGSRTYRFKGEWSANLAWTGGTVAAKVFENCEKTKA